MIYNHYDIIVPDSMKPINSGMIALVYKALKKDTTETVIVKIKRKNIEKRLEDAIDNLLFLANLMSYVPQLNSFQLKEIIEKNIKLLTEQTNFVKEVDNMKKMSENCKNLKYVVIPKPYSEITDRFINVIVMDFIDGVKISSINEADYVPFAKQVVKFGTVTTLVHGCTHGDLHGGNILFIKDEKERNPKYIYKLGVLDFGIVYEIDADFKSNIFDILTNVFNTPPDEIAKQALKAHLLDPQDLIEQLSEEHYNNLVNIISEIINDALKKSKHGNQVQVYKFLNNFYSYINNHNLTELGLRPSENFVKTQLALAMAHGVTMTLCKDDYMSLAEQVVNELFHLDILKEDD